MRVLFLGTGTSTGVPMLGCKCSVCTSSDIRDNRLRSSIKIEIEDTNILIDCTPDVRTQFLSLPFKKIDALLITHEHFDHVGGIEDLRPFSVFGPINIYAEKKVEDALRLRMPYCFIQNPYEGMLDIALNRITDLDPIYVNNVEIIPIRVMHYKLPILGFRINNFAYLTDVKTIPTEELDKLLGLDVLVISALRHEKHISHQTLSEAIKVSQKLDPKRTIFTHMSHDIGLHTEVEGTLPNNFEFAYDGLEVVL